MFCKYGGKKIAMHYSIKLKVKVFKVLPLTMQMLFKSLLKILIERIPWQSSG